MIEWEKVERCECRGAGGTSHRHWRKWVGGKVVGSGYATCEAIADLGLEALTDILESR